ncbi:MAG: iron-sulfur cluster carrier protein ApbC [Hyphomicrobiales bacterium]
MGEISQDRVLEQLAKVRGPDLEGDLVSLGLVSEIVISDADVMFALTVEPQRANELEPMRQAAQKAVEQIDGTGKVTVVLTAAAEQGRTQAQASGMPNVHQAPGRKAPPEGANMAPPPPIAGRPGAAPSPKASGVPGVRHIIAVASGKGGVGKSTTACNLALGLAANGAKVGILDADIYGPSMPRLLGITGRPQVAGGRNLQPMEGFGLKVMSMGFLVEEDTPMIWRGPMVISAITQMLREVEWGELDFMVVDMPPGTGDAQLTMAQQVPLAGAVIVSTPQDLALIDARKGLNMFRRVDVPVLGIVENMSFFACPKCGERSDIFGHGGARDEADKMGVPFLGEVPLDMLVRERSDSGQPVVATAPDTNHAAIYRDIAAKVLEEVERESALRPAPRIVTE